MPTPTERGDAPGHSRRLVRSELDLLGLGITSLLADDPCHYSPLVLVGTPAATAAVLHDIHQHWQRLQQERPGAASRTLFLDPDRLARDLEAAVGDGLDSVHRRWIAADLVVLDGIGQLAAAAPLAVLAHLLDRLSDAGRRVVCSLTQEPQAFGDLPEAVASRLGAGLVVTVRDTAAVAPPVDTAQGTPQPTIRRILTATSRHFGLVPDDLIGTSRRRTIAVARGIAMHLARQLCGESLAGIGRRFSGRDHTTVMHAIRVTQERIERDPRVAEDFEAIVASLGKRKGRQRS